MTAQWRDTTSYSRDNKERVPNCFSLELPSLRISVVKGHIYYPAQWVMHCHALGLDTVPLTEDIDPGQAKSEALATVRNTLVRMMADIEKVL